MTSVADSTQATASAATLPKSAVAGAGMPVAPPPPDLDTSLGPVVDRLTRAETGQSGLPVHPPLTAIIEIVLLIVLPTALDYWWPAFPSLSDMQPHLFWLPILLLSLQYGTVSGLLAAGTAIAATGLLGWSEQEIGENHFTYLLRVWAQPILWLTTALVLGQFRMRQIEQKQELARLVTELSNQRTAIADYARNLRTRCEGLEREVIGRRAPASHAMLASLGRIGTAGPEQMRTVVGSSLEQVLGNCQASVFARTGDELRLLVAHGWTAESPWRDRLSAADPLFVAVAQHGRALSVLQPGDEEELAGEGLAAVPVFAANDRRVLGVLKVDAAHPGELDGSLIDRLQAVAVQIAPLLESGRNGIATPAILTAAIGPVGEVDPRPRLWRHVRWQRGAAASKSSIARKPATG